MNELYETFEKINNYPKQIYLLRTFGAACLTVFAITLMVLHERKNLFIIILLCVCVVIAIILFILSYMFEKDTENKLSKLKKEYCELKIKNSNNVSNISVPIPGSIFLRGPESDGNILIIAILVNDTIEYQYMNEYELKETFK